jgi:hypothetical protein
MVVASAIALLGGATGASAELRDPHTKRPAARDVDVRTGLGGGVAVTKAQRQAAHALTGVSVEFDKGSGVPSRAIDPAGAITAKSGASAEAIARGFVADHAGLFRLSRAGLARFVLAGQNVTHNFTAVTLQQTDAGRDVLGARMTFGIDADGRILSYDGSYVPDAAADSSAGLSASDAVRAALRAVGERAPGLTAKWSAGAASRHTVFENSVARDIRDPSDIDARLVTFPMPGGRPARLAWKTLTEVNKIGSYESVVDADSGALLSRRNLYDTAAEGTVYTAQHPAIAGATRTIVPFTGASFDNNGWVGTNRETNGNNVNAYQDKDEDDASDFQPQTPASPDANFQHFNYAFTDAWRTSGGTDITTDQAAVVTQMFYYANKYHDYLYGLGFNETSRNFQVDNFGRGGAGSDPVLAEADDDYLNSGCNANFVTPSDGSSPRMQMFVGNTSCGDNFMQRAMNGDTIFHESTHGLSHRLVSSGSLGSGTQTSAMGEGWGDFMATSYWNDPAYGDYNNGDTAKGIRSVGYDTSTLDYSNLCNGGCEEHSDGEIWATVLWALRVKLIAKYGYSANRPDTTTPAAADNDGNRRSEQLVVDAMKLSGTNPTFLSMRDKILAADAADYANADECLIWGVFAKRKMGFSATVGASQGHGTDATDGPSQCLPTASAGGAYSTPEGTNQTLSASASTGAGLTYEWDLDNDGQYDDATGVSPAFTNVGRDGVFTVGVKVTTGDGGFSATASTTVTVTNAVPVVGTITANTPQPEGSTVTVSGAVTDAGWEDPLSATINWGDGGATTGLTGTEEHTRPDGSITYSVDHAYGTDGVYTVTICAADDDTTNNCSPKIVTITNVPPTVGPIATNSPRNENTSLTISGAISDPGWLDPLSATINWGEPGGAAVALTGTLENAKPDATLTYNATHTYGDDGVFTITICAADDDTTNNCSTKQVTINNVNPAAAIDKSGATDVNGTPVFFAHAGQPVAFSGRSTDPGSDDQTLRWNWDDGGPAIDATRTFLNNTAINPDPDPSPTINPRDVTDARQHAFGQACLYNVGFSSLDDDAGSAADAVAVLITGNPANHDKSAGFWAHEYQSASGDEIDPATLACYLKITGFLSKVFDEANDASTFGKARKIVAADYPTLTARIRLDRVLLACWLNFANGAFDWNEPVDLDNNGVNETTFRLAMQAAEAVRLNPGATNAQLDAQRDLLQQLDS